MNEELRQRFVALCIRIGQSGQAAANVAFDELVQRYSVPYRAYHSLEHHIAKALKTLDWAVEKYGRWANIDWDSIEFALWYHDCVYDATKGDNEFRSAIIGSTWHTGIAVRTDKMPLIHSLIMATTHQHPPKERWHLLEMQVITDIDLAGLGGSWEEFTANGRKIRMEYAFADDTQWKEGRKKFAEKMLERSHVFSTELFRKEYEVRARENLTRSAKGEE